MSTQRETFVAYAKLPSTASADDVIDHLSQAVRRLENDGVNEGYLLDWPGLSIEVEQDEIPMPSFADAQRLVTRYSEVIFTVTGLKEVA